MSETDKPDWMGKALKFQERAWKAEARVAELEKERIAITLAMQFACTPAERKVLASMAALHIVHTTYPDGQSTTEWDDVLPAIRAELARRDEVKP